MSRTITAIIWIRSSGGLFNERRPISAPILRHAAVNDGGLCTQDVVQLHIFL